MTEESGSIRQQIGEILATVKAMDRQITDGERRADDAIDRVNSEMRTVKHDQRQYEQFLTSKLGLAEIRLREVERVIAGIAKDVKGLSVVMSEMEEPFQQLVTFRRRMASMMALGISIVAVLWAIASPIWDFIVRHIARLWSIGDM